MIEQLSYGGMPMPTIDPLEFRYARLIAAVQVVVETPGISADGIREHLTRALGAA